MSTDTGSWLYPEPLPAILYGHPDYDNLIADREKTQSFAERVLVPFLIDKYCLPDDEFSAFCMRRVFSAETNASTDIRHKRVTLSTNRRKLIREMYEQCAVCRSAATRLAVDHIVPLALGGYNAAFNLQILCYECNEDKAALKMTEWLEIRADQTLAVAA